MLVDINEISPVTVLLDVAETVVPEADPISKPVGGVVSPPFPPNSAVNPLKINFPELAKAITSLVPRIPFLKVLVPAFWKVTILFASNTPLITVAPPPPTKRFALTLKIGIVVAFTLGK